jgi:hypothetical protein
VKLDERIRVLPVPARNVATVDERDVHVRVVDQSIRERHAHRARAHDEVIGRQRSHRHAGTASGASCGTTTMPQCGLGHRDQVAGSMFWFTWKRLPGSYLALTVASRW